MNSQPLISVCVITYNHENFIFDCLNGIFQQDYPNIEVIISNDCSLDNTDKIISEYIESNSRVGLNFKYFNQKVNLGVSKNFLESLKKCSGEFIAICEGDDFWFNGKYLSNHYQFLSTNIQNIFSLSSVNYLDHYTKVVTEKIDLITKPSVNTDINFLMVASGFHLGIQSMMFKSTVELFKRLDGYNLFFDTVLSVELLNLGKGRALDIGGSMYRIQQAGIMSGSNFLFRIRFNFFLFFEIIHKNKKVGSLQNRALFLASEYYLAILRFSKYRYLIEFFIVSLTKFISLNFTWKVIKMIIFNTLSSLRKKKVFSSTN